MIKTYYLVSPYVKNPIHAVFFYDTDKKEFGLYIPSEVKKEELPVVFSIYKEKGLSILNHEQTKKWVDDRIVPPSRQNIGMILKNIGIEQYDEFEILMYCKGRSCMDEFELQECSSKVLDGIHF